MEKVKLTEQELRTLYVEKHHSIAEITALCGYSYATVLSWLIDCGIQRRRGNRNSSSDQTREYPTKEELLATYVEQKWTLTRTALHFGYKSEQVITRLLSLYGIERRFHKPHYTYVHSHKPTKEELIELYVEQMIPMHAIAKQFGYSLTAVQKWLDTYGIKRRQGNPLALVYRGQRLPTSEELSELLKNNTYDEIAGAYGVAIGSVQYWIRKYGIAPRTKCK